MNWFDASGLKSIAKTALKEAQRTIDKALDIKEEEDNALHTDAPIDTNSEDFFSNWGVTATNTKPSNETVAKKNEDNVKDQLPDKEQQQNPSTSLWGSFTGSFFENAKGADNNKSSSFDSLDDTVDAGSHFVSSKLQIQHSEDSICEANEDEVKIESENERSAEIPNRLSVVSLESGKNSSESVDILSDFNTTPESSELIDLGPSLSNSSSTGLKPSSDSVEVLGLPDSLTSPSSVEILGTDSISSRRHSGISDEFVSPQQSPLVETNKSSSIEKLTPDSVEVIPDEPDEENSVAEDTMSYTSISESTSTVLENAIANPLKSRLLKSKHSISDTEPPKSPSKVSDAITRAPSRSNMHLPLNQINLIDTQPQSTKEDISLVNKTNVIDIPVNELNLLDTSIDEGSQSDKTVISTENIMESSSDTSTATETSHNSSATNSSNVKNMLADAMTEKSDNKSVMTTSSNSMNLENITMSQIGLEMPPRETSPISSESRSDLVKIGSGSGHTSGDELETTTSSDIEIISSPNESSSTQSRHSPAKSSFKKTEDDALLKMTIKKSKGHNRELSGASSVSDDSHSDVDRLVRRLSEMTEILEARESKLIDVNRRYAELQEVNKHLQQQLDSIVTKQIEAADVSQVTEEYTQRLSALEKKFQQVIREKDTLRKQLEQCKQESALRMSKNELESLISEKDEIIKELREEGEKLSKQQLQHSNIIKKLRAKEKENETTIKHQKENIESMTSEMERLKKSLAAKDEVERNQIEAVHQLTAKNKKLENEVNKVRSQLDDITQKYDTTKKSLEAAKKELVDKNRASNELVQRDKLLESLENEKRITESQNEEMMNQLEDLRMKVRQTEQDYLKKEQLLRQENAELLRRLEEVESRNEELSQSVLEVSKPLVRQFESLQATHNMKMASYEKVEQELSLKISELQTKLHSATNTERLAKEECVSIRSKLADLEGQLASATHQNEIMLLKVQQMETEKQVELQELNMKINKLEEALKSEKQKNEDFDKNIQQLEQQLVVEKANLESERKRSVVEQQLELERQSPPNAAGNTSPTLSLGKASIADSMNSSFWSQDEAFEVGNAPRYTNMFEMQMLQSNLKQRDGELQQLQWELNRREQERTLLNSEISNLLTKVEELEGKVTDYDVIKTQVVELQQKYDTMCQLFGEKVEENEELKLDLEDVKDMYKSQIDELLRQQRQQK